MYLCVIGLESGRYVCVFMCDRVRKWEGAHGGGGHTVAPTHPSTAHMRNALYADCVEKSRTAPHLPKAGQELFWSSVGTVGVRRFGDGAKGRDRIVAINVPHAMRIAMRNHDA